MPRPRRSQSQHDQKVRELARSYGRKGYDVEADVHGWPQPESIGGVRPDLKVRKGGHETVLEVETEDSKDSSRDLKQQKTFKQWSKRSTSRHYKRVVTE